MGWFVVAHTMGAHRCFRWVDCKPLEGGYGRENEVVEEHKAVSKGSQRERASRGRKGMAMDNGRMVSDGEEQRRAETTYTMREKVDVCISSHSLFLRFFSFFSEKPL